MLKTLLHVNLSFFHITLNSGRLDYFSFIATIKGLTNTNISFKSNY